MLSDRLKILRNELELTQEEVAKELNVSRQTYANWEINRSEPSIEMLLSLSTFYKVSIDFLCENTDLRNNIYKDPNLCKYLNKCISIYDEFFKKIE